MVMTPQRLVVFVPYQQAEATDLMNYQRRHVKGRQYTWLVLGERNSIDFAYLRKDWDTQ